MKNIVNILLFFILFLSGQTKILLSMKGVPSLAKRSSKRLKRRSLRRREIIRAKERRKKRAQEEVEELTGPGSYHKVEDLSIAQADLVVAIENNDPIKVREALVLMKERGKSINSPLFFREGLTALHYAVMSSDETILNLILSVFGVDINRQDNRGYTPLHMAVFEKKLGLAKALLSNRSINVNCIDKRGETPLHLAVRSKDIDFIVLFLSYGADPYLKNGSQESANDLAKMFKIISPRTTLEGVYNVYFSPLAKDLLRLNSSRVKQYGEYIATILLYRGVSKEILRKIRNTMRSTPKSRNRFIRKIMPNIKQDIWCTEIVKEFFFFIYSGCVQSIYEKTVKKICKKLGLNFKQLAGYSNLQKDMGNLLSSRDETGDFIIYLHDESEIKVHRAILYARSEFFRIKFDGHSFDGRDFCSFEDYPCSIEIWNLMLEFLYTGNISSELEDSEINQLIDLGKALKVRIQEELLPVLERVRI